MIKPLLMLVIGILLGSLWNNDFLKPIMRFLNPVPVINQNELREYFSNNRVGRSPDYGVVKNGDDYLATFHSYMDDKDACNAAIKLLGSDYSCVRLNGSQQKEINQNQLRDYFSAHRVGKSPDHGVLKNEDDYLVTFHSYSDDGGVCRYLVRSLSKEYRCISLNK